MVDVFAALAKPRIVSLLRLQGAKRVYEPTPGALNSKIEVDGREVILAKWKRALQPYREIARFVSEDRVTQFIIDPGLLPLVTAISKDMLGRKLLVTRPVAVTPGFKGAAAYVGDFGVRIHLFPDEDSQDTIVAWECLYGVL